MSELTWSSFDQRYLETLQGVIPNITEVINTARLINMTAREVIELVETHGPNSVDELRKKIGNDPKLKWKLYENFIKENDDQTKLEEVYRNIPESDKPEFLNIYFRHPYRDDADGSMLDEAIEYFKEGKLIPYANWAIVHYLWVDGISSIASSHPKVIHDFMGSCIQYGNTEDIRYCTYGNVRYPMWEDTLDEKGDKKGYLHGSVDLNAYPFRIKDLLAPSHVHPKADDRQLWELLRKYLWKFTELVEFGALFDHLKFIDELNEFEERHPEIMKELHNHHLFEKYPFSQIAYDGQTWKWKRKPGKPQLTIVKG